MAREELSVCCCIGYCSYYDHESFGQNCFSLLVMLSFGLLRSLLILLLHLSTEFLVSFTNNSNSFCLGVLFLKVQEEILGTQTDLTWCYKVGEEELQELGDNIRSTK